MRTATPLHFTGMSHVCLYPAQLLSVSIEEFVVSFDSHTFVISSCEWPKYHFQSFAHLFKFSKKPAIGVYDDDGNHPKCKYNIFHKNWAKDSAVGFSMMDDETNCVRSHIAFINIMVFPVCLFSIFPGAHKSTCIM